MDQVQHEKSDPFFDWFATNVEFLWSFSHFFSRANSEYLDEMLYILNLSRSRISFAMQKGRSFDEATFEFLKLWFDRLKRPRSHSALAKADLNWEEQFLIFALVREKISVSKVSHWLRKKEASAKFELLTALAKVAGIAETELRSGSRDCIRHDLLLADTLVGSYSPDPLKIVNAESIQQHVRGCERCKELEMRIRAVTAEFSVRELYAVPAQFHAQVLNDVGTRWHRLVKREWFGSWPLWIKVPVQVSIAIFVLALVLNPSQFKVPSPGVKISWLSRGQKILMEFRTGIVNRWDNLIFTTKSWVVDAGPEMGPARGLEFVVTPEATMLVSESEALSRFLNSKHFDSLSEKTLPPKELLAAVAPAPIAISTAATKVAPAVAPALVAISTAATKVAPVAAPAPTPALLIVKKPVPAESPVAKPPAAPPIFSKVTTPAPAPMPVPAPTPISTPAPVVAASKPAATKVVEPQSHSIFYRWGAYSNNLAADSTEINELLKAVKAEMAGELPFGAEYKGGRYFHFSISKSEFEELLKKVKNLGLTSFSSNPTDSDREIPLDRSRVVFLLLPKNSSSESNGN